MKVIKNYFKNVVLLYGHLIVGLWTGDWSLYNSYLLYTSNYGLVKFD